MPNEKSKKIPVEISPEIEHLLSNSLENQDKHHKITQDLLTANLQHSEKSRNEQTTLAENHLEKLDQIHQELKKESGDELEEGEIRTVRGKKGDKGDKGDMGNKGNDGITPQKGIHYWTEEDIQNLLKRSTPQKGVHYFTPQEIEEFKNQVTPIKGVHYDDGEKGKPGPAGVDGESAPLLDFEKVIEEVLKKVPKSKEQKAITVADILKELKGKLAYQDLKDAPEFRMGGTGYLREITDIDVTGLADGYTLQWNVLAQKWKVVALSSGPVFVPNEIVSGSGTTWILAKTPIIGSVILFAQGTRLYPGTDPNFGYSISGKNITTNLSYSAGDLIADYRT